MTKAQRIAHKRGNQERKAAMLAANHVSKTLTGEIIKVPVHCVTIQDGKYTKK